MTGPYSTLWMRRALRQMGLKIHATLSSLRKLQLQPQLISIATNHHCGAGPAFLGKRVSVGDDPMVAFMRIIEALE